MSPSQFARLLHHYRYRAALSQNALARKAGIDPSYINRLERGLRPPPTQKVVQNIAAALGLDSSETDHLLLQAGYAPVADTVPDIQVPLDPALQMFADILADRDIPQEEIEALKQQMWLIRKRYSGG